MAQEFKMPMVAESVVEGEIGRWFVKVGDYVKRDQPIVEILTDKVNVEIPSPIEGYLLKIAAEEGQIAKVGEVIAVFGNEGERVEGSSETPKPTEKSDAPAAEKPAPSASPQRQAASEPAPAEDVKAGKTKVKVMPAVRKLAKELGVDLNTVTPSGTGGIITETDIRAAAPVTQPVPFGDSYYYLELRSKDIGNNTPVTHTPPTPPKTPPSPPGKTPAGREERVAFRGIRRTVAENLVRSHHTTVATLHVDEADVSDLVALREVEKRKAAEKGIKLTYLPFFIKAIVAALKKYPYVNASLDEEAGEIVLKHYYNIGIATNTEQGLMVPVLKDADKKNIWELAQEIAELAEKARAGKLALDDVQDSTFSITNIGSMRGQISFPIINLPNAAIIGIQSITKRPVVRNGEIVARDMINLSLAFDHRVFDGATASAFTTEIIRMVETPALLFWNEG